ncbi:MAG TPA: phosphotransferase [Nitrospira sp.]|jgi:aminoglycoside/choline kinase family phosphotransferase|nr:phosphotransferase [Nitrospira sp.]
MTTTKPAAPTTPLAPPDSSNIAKTVANRLPFRGEFAALTALAGDASNRRYFRITLRGTPSSLILMQLADPEGFKKSEEAVSGASSPITELPFTNVLTHLQRTGVPVPRLHYYDREAGLLYLEDFGDLTLADACRQADRAKVEALYRQAIDQLVQFQVKGTTPPEPHCIAFHRRFDVPLLMWEFDHFLEYGISARLGKAMAPADEAAIRGEFQRIADLLAEQPQVLVHRDYHSRNLMVDGSRIGIIDFQDALMGPATYDLASLLKDAYIELDEAVVNSLIDHFLDGLAVRGQGWRDRAAFRRLFDLTSIQRNLKAAGRFVYIDRVKHNPKFLADIPRVLGYVKRNLAKYPELAPLRQHMAPYVAELQ